MKKPKNDFPQQMMMDNKLTTNPSELAEGMNEYFVKKVEDLKEAQTNLAESDDAEAVKELKKYLEKQGKQDLTFSLKEIDDKKLDDLLKRLKGKKSHGLDWICGYSLKLGSNVIKEELKFIINLSISSGRFCEEWKRAKVLPVYKNKGLLQEKSSFRPVSNLPEASKLVEMAIYDQVYDFF